MKTVLTVLLLLALFLLLRSAVYHVLKALVDIFRDGK